MPKPTLCAAVWHTHMHMHMSKERSIDNMADIAAAVGTGDVRTGVAISEDNGEATRDAASFAQNHILSLLDPVTERRSESDAMSRVGGDEFCRSFERYRSLRNTE